MRFIKQLLAGACGELSKCGPSAVRFNQFHRYTTAAGGSANAATLVPSNSLLLSFSLFFSLSLSLSLSVSLSLPVFGHGDDLDHRSQTARVSSAPGGVTAAEGHFR